MQLRLRIQIIKKKFEKKKVDDRIESKANYFTSTTIDNDANIKMQSYAIQGGGTNNVKFNWTSL